MMKTVHLLIKGKVQGVFYRATAKKIAAQLGINGWIRNTNDEHVEVIASGKQSAVDDFVAWCRKGPDDAEVDEIITIECNPGDYNDFRIIR